MPIPHILATLLRLTQFTLATITLGLTAHLININTTPARTATFDGPLTRLIYTLVIAAISIAISLLLFTFPTSNLTRANTATIAPSHIALDFLLSASWFAAFAVLHDWDDDVMHCGSSWNWESVRFWGNACEIWGAVQASAFLSAVAWFAGCGVGSMQWARGRKGNGEETVAGADGPVTTAGATGRRKWWGKGKT